jgi:hypothetical protein
MQAVNPVLMQQLLASVLAGQQLSTGANRELDRLARSKGMSADELARLILSSLIPAQ